MRVKPALSALASGVVACLLLTGCGGGSTPDAAASGSPTPTAASTTSTATPTPTATGGTAAAAPVSKAEFYAKLKEEPDLDGVPADEVECIAGVYVKYLDPEEQRKYVNGAITVDDFNDPDNPTAKKEMLACIGAELDPGNK